MKKIKTTSLAHPPFSTEKGKEGTFLGASQTTTSYVTDANGSPAFNSEANGGANYSSSSKNIGYGDAAKVIGAENLAKGVSKATGGILRHFPHQVAQDFKQHPLKQVGIVLGAASLPVGAVSLWWGVGLGVAGAGAAIADDALHVTPY